eukprot:Opistho-1_new@51510
MARRAISAAVVAAALLLNVYSTGVEGRINAPAPPSPSPPALDLARTCVVGACVPVIKEADSFAAPVFDDRLRMPSGKSTFFAACDESSTGRPLVVNVAIVAAVAVAEYMKLLGTSGVCVGALVAVLAVLACRMFAGTKRTPVIELLDDAPIETGSVEEVVRDECEEEEVEEAVEVAAPTELRVQRVRSSSTASDSGVELSDDDRSETSSVCESRRLSVEEAKPVEKGACDEGAFFECDADVEEDDEDLAFALKLAAAPVPSKKIECPQELRAFLVNTARARLAARPIH